MTNQEKIEKMFRGFRERVHNAGNKALCDQLQDTLELSVGLHEQLEGGYHTHHSMESDTHGWAVADGAGLVGSGASHLQLPNEYGSAESDAREEAVRDNSGQKGVFSAIMVYPFEGTTEHEGNRAWVSDEPHDSVRFEEKIQELLKTHVRQWFTTFYRKGINTVTR